MTDFKVGDRVQINPVTPQSYLAVWQKRIAAGLFGEIIGPGWRKGTWRVRLDMPPRAKYVHDWLWTGVPSCDLMMEAKQ